MSRFWFVLLAWLLLVSLSHAEQATYHFGPNLSEADACARALQKLKRESVEAQCGVQMAAALTRHRNAESDVLDLFHFEMLGGAVVHLSEVHNVIQTEKEGLGHSCRAQASLDVVCNQGRRDPGFAPSFRLFAQLNQQVFRDGEDMLLKLRIETPLYLKVFQYLPDETSGQRLQLLYPNAWQSQNPLPVMEQWHMPDGYRLQVKLPPGHTKASEYLILIGTRHPLALPEKLSEEVFFAALTSIPLEDRREALIPYQITAAGSATPQAVSDLGKTRGLP